jgi:Lhr-like helicase
MSELTINLLTDKESSSALQSFTRMIGTIGGTIGRKKGREISASLSSMNLDQLQNETLQQSSPNQTLTSNDYHVIGAARLDMPQFTIHPGKILEKNISIMKDKKLVGVIAVTYIYVPLYRSKVVIFFLIHLDSTDQLKRVI